MKEWVNPIKKKILLKMIYSRGFDLDGDIINYKDGKYYVHWFDRIVKKVL